MTWLVGTSYCLTEILLANNSQERQPLVDLNSRLRLAGSIRHRHDPLSNDVDGLYAYGNVDRVLEGRYNELASTRLLNPAFGLVLTPIIRLGAGLDYRGSVGTGRRA